jgi:hypothetical protein
MRRCKIKIIAIRPLVNKLGKEEACVGCVQHKSGGCALSNRGNCLPVCDVGEKIVNDISKQFNQLARVKDNEKGI